MELAHIITRLGISLLTTKIHLHGGENRVFSILIQKGEQNLHEKGQDEEKHYAAQNRKGGAIDMKRGRMRKSIVQHTARGPCTPINLAGASGVGGHTKNS